MPEYSRERIAQKDFYRNVQSNFIYNRLKLDNAPVSTNKRMAEVRHICLTELYSAIERTNYGYNNIMKENSGFH